jgi:Acetoacetate decarboxylase (ADC)
MIKPPVPELVIPASARTSLPRLPTFVEHGGEIACRHPADAINSRLYGFVVPADRDLLDTYCDSLFNIPTDGDQHWEAASGEVLLNFVDIPTMGSTDLLDQRLGFTHEQEAAIWFPVVDRKRNRFAWAIPYMFVDSALALAGGREVYGFPKQLGKMNIPVERSAPPELSIDTVTLDVHDPDSEAKKHRVVTVERSGQNATLGAGSSTPQLLRSKVRKAARTDSADGHAFGRATRSARRRDDELPDLLFFEHLVREDVPMLLLKQFRDAHVQGAACYQAVVLVDMVVSAFRGGGLLPDDYRVRTAELAGEPIMRELGIAASCTPRVAFWLHFDFLVQLGQILWEAELDRP